MAVCSVGLDMIVVPGSTDAATISAIIADETAIGMVNNKTTAVRIIPAPGKVRETLWSSAVCWAAVRNAGPATRLQRLYSARRKNPGAPVQSQELSENIEEMLLFG